MDDLPTELTTKILGSLGPTDLSSRCSTDRSIVALCANKLFWLQKIRSLSRREIQDQWLLPLAELGDERLLGHLLDAVERERVQIDDRIIVTALMYLDQPNKPKNRVLDRLRRLIRLDDYRQYANSQSFNLQGAIIKKRWSIVINAIQTNSLENLVVLSDELPTIIDNDKTFLFLKRLLEPYLSLLPSPSALLMYCLTVESRDPTESTKAIRLERIAGTIQYLLGEHLLPYLYQTGQTELLNVYEKDLSCLQNLFKAFIAAHRSNRRFHNDYGYITIAYGSIDDFVRVFGDDWDVYDRSPYPYIHNVDLFKRLAEETNYDIDMIWSGYLSMEPEEWIDWFEKSIETNDRDYKQTLIKDTVSQAKKDGYSYFVTGLTKYARDNNFVIEDE